MPAPPDPAGRRDFRYGRIRRCAVACRRRTPAERREKNRLAFGFPERTLAGPRQLKTAREGTRPRIAQETPVICISFDPLSLLVIHDGGKGSRRQARAADQGAVD